MTLTRLVPRRAAACLAAALAFLPQTKESNLPTRPPVSRA